MWFLGSLAGGALVTWLLRDRPAVSISLLLFAVALFLVLLISPAAGWYMLLIPLLLIAMYLVFKALPWLLGFALGAGIVLLLLAGLGSFLASLGL